MTFDNDLLGVRAAALVDRPPNYFICDKLLVKERKFVVSFDLFADVVKQSLGSSKSACEELVGRLTSLFVGEVILQIYTEFAFPVRGEHWILSYVCQVCRT